MQATSSTERQRKRFLYTLCAVIIVVAFTILTAINATERNFKEIPINLAVIAVMTASLAALKRWDADQTIYRASHALISLGLCYSVSIGAGEETVLFWALIAPLLFFFFFGKREGIIWTILFYACLIVILFLPGWFDGHVYSGVTISRFLITLTIISIVGFGLESSRTRFSRLLSEKNRALRNEKQQLEKALKDVKALSGLLPICSNCKKIRNDEGYWEQVEVYVRDHSEAEFSHGICPECIKQLYPGFKGKKDSDKS
ncbi:hypothetical protein DSCW_29310 [Desulfosarcina widdelii]|uniref:MASE6 domain-containing protein n=1 Tax=Desulfosarcina widdelii TaxID=947919 RepID=A0A5K7ZAN0_9BACT|nr:hypothetical protein [Desulfosarcina widdelii]BBO75514.1 hypothetical protein DSCW_29310 [Desulfosarcina widdelii]